MLGALVVVLALLGAVYGQLLYTQRCPTVPLLADFDIKKYEGVWYEQSRTFSAFQNIGQCWTRNYTASPTNSNEYYVKTSFSTLLSPSSVDYRIHKKANSNSWSSVDYSVVAVPIIRGSYQIVETDYENWAVEWECNDALGVHTEITRILGRVPTLAAPTYEEARTAAGRHNLDIRQLQIVNNGGCLSIPQFIREVVLRIAGATTSAPTPSAIAVNVPGGNEVPSSNQVTASTLKQTTPATTGLSVDNSPASSVSSEDKIPASHDATEDKTPNSSTITEVKAPTSSTRSEVKPITSNTPSEVKPPTSSTPSEVKPPTSSTPSEVKPPTSSTPSEVKPPTSSTPSEVKPITSNTPSEVKTPTSSTPSAVKPPTSSTPSAVKPPSSGSVLKDKPPVSGNASEGQTQSSSSSVPAKAAPKVTISTLTKSYIGDEIVENSELLNGEDIDDNEIE